MIYWILEIIHDLVPYIIYVIYSLMLFFFGYFVAMFQINMIWKNNLKYHMDEVVKDEIEIKDEKLKMYKKEIYELKDENENMKNKINIVEKVIKNGSESTK